LKKLAITSLPIAARSKGTVTSESGFYASVR
jgi:hypothetical protein